MLIHQIKRSLMLNIIKQQTELIIYITKKVTLQITSILDFIVF